MNQSLHHALHDPKHKLSKKQLMIVIGAGVLVVLGAVIAFALMLHQPIYNLLAPLWVPDYGKKSLTAAVPTKASDKTYYNAQYGFSVALPDSWKGFTAAIDTWQGSITGATGEVVTEQGPQINLRYPLWTAAKPRQDIPVMIFALSQWDALQKGKFHIGAAPIGPSELGRNAHYVFALPARYNFAYLTGYEEVDQILKSGALKAF
jgi:hypothetical protein